jgi:hypothetical protein
LNVLDERHFQRQLVGDLANNRGYTAKTCTLGCAPTAFPCDELIAIPQRPNNNWLDDSAGLNRPRKFVESFFAETRAWLVRTRLDEVNIDFLRTVRHFASRGRRGG